MESRKKLLKEGSWLFLFFGLFFILLAVRYMANLILAIEPAAITFFIISTLSHFVSLSYVLFLALYTPIIAIFPSRKMAWLWSGFIITIGCCFLIVDASVFKLYHFHINWFVVKMAFGKGASQIFQFHFTQYLLALFVVLLMGAAMFTTTYFFFKKSNILKFFGGKYIALAVLLLVIITHSWHAWADANNYSPVTRLARNYPLFFPLTARRFMQKAGLINAESGKRNLALASAIPDKGLNYPRQPIHQENLAKKSNLIFILIDSWYYKAFDSVAMPNLYAFSKQCEYYSHHYSGSNGTSMGLFSLFYSLPSTYWDNVLSTHASPVLVDLALQNGYVIKAFPSATLVDPPIDRTIFSSVTNLKTETTGDQSHDRDKQLTIDWTSISQNFRPGVSNEPVFAFLFYDALHAVSRPPDYPGPFQPEWRNARFELLDSDTDPIPFLNLYKNAAHFLDSLVGVVLKDLKTKGLLENSWIIITGDHGQEFNDSKKNYWGHYSNYTKAQLQVPFMLYREGIKARKFTHWTSHYDVVPTLLTDLFKATNPVEEYSFGQHLHESNRDWLLVGNHDSFAIVQPDKITNVYQFRSLEVTDAQLNPLYDSAVDVDLINKIILKANAFRKE